MRGTGTILRNEAKVATVVYALEQAGTLGGAPYIGTITVLKGERLEAGMPVALVLADGSKLKVTPQSSGIFSSRVNIRGAPRYGVISTGPLSLPEDK